MMMKMLIPKPLKILPATLLFTVLSASSVLAATGDYIQDLKSQLASLDKKYSKKEAEYFRDMGILARKADEAGSAELTSEIVLTQLLPQMKQYILDSLEEIKSDFSKNKMSSLRKLTALGALDRYYQPTGNFLETAGGQAITTDLIQRRERALAGLTKGCSEVSIEQGMEAIKMTGLYQTNSLPEIDSLRKLIDGVSCCLGWKSELRFTRSNEFENDYEKGTMSEEGNLRLESNRNDLSEARWTGEWIYKFTGREGKGEGVSQATLIYHRGDESAVLAITPSRVTSTGRMNFPNALSGEKRTFAVEGSILSPVLDSLGQPIDVTGCKKK